MWIAAPGLRWKTAYASVFSFDVVMALPCSKFDRSLWSSAGFRLVSGRTKSWIARCQVLGIGCGNYGRRQWRRVPLLAGTKTNGARFIHRNVVNGRIVAGIRTVQIPLIWLAFHRRGEQTCRVPRHRRGNLAGSSAEIVPIARYIGAIVVF